VRLRCAYFLKCLGVVKDPATGEIVELRCTYDPATRGGDSPDGRKVKATLHWVSAAHAVTAEVRLYDRLFNTETPGGDDTGWLRELDPHSLRILDSAFVEPALLGLEPSTRVQFERLGYFCVDPETTTTRPVFNRIVGLKDQWVKIQQRQTENG
jgi:glutaminyl-tRNA synthetase